MAETKIKKMKEIDSKKSEKNKKAKRSSDSDTQQTLVLLTERVERLEYQVQLLAEFFDKARKDIESATRVLNLAHAKLLAMIGGTMH